VDVVILDEGRDSVIPLRGCGSDQARALAHLAAMYAIVEKVRLHCHSCRA
jgi:hypothetical protein